MYIKDFRNTKEFESYLLDNKNQKNIKLFYDIETLRYNEESVYIDGYKPTRYKNIMYSFAISFFDFEDELKTVSFFNFSEFVRFILKVTKNKTNDKSRYKPMIELIAYNNNKYDNHFLLREALIYLDESIICKNMYLKNSIIHDFETSKKDLTKDEKYNGVFLEKRIKSANNLEFEFYYHNLSFKTSDFLMKTNTNLKTIGKKLFDLNLIDEVHLKTDFNYREFDVYEDMTDNQALNYARKVYDNLNAEQNVYIENDVIILALGYKNYHIIYQGFSLDKLTFSSNVLESYKTNDLASFQLLNKTLDNQAKVDYTKFEYQDMNFYDYLKGFYKGGLNFYNDRYIATTLKCRLFSIDLNSSYPYAMDNFDIPTFMYDFSRFVDQTKIDIKYNNHYFLYTVDKNIFNVEILSLIRSKVFRQMLVKYYSTSNSYVSINSNTLKMIQDVMHISIKQLTVISYIEYETVAFGAKHKLEEYYFIKSQGKIDNVLDMTTPYEYEILDEINEHVFSQSEIDISKVYMNGIYGIPALRPYFNVFYKMTDGQIENRQNNFRNSKRNILFSVFVTSVSLYNLLSPLQYLSSSEIDDGFVYCDTDSLYIKYAYFDKLPSELFDSIRLGAWDIENKNISSFYVLNHKKYAYYTEDEQKIKIRSGGIRHSTFNTDMSFDEFVKTQFHDGAYVENTRSLMNEQGVITIYEAKTKLEKGRLYSSVFSGFMDNARADLMSKIKKDIMSGLEDFMYIESDLGSFSQREIFETKETTKDTYRLEILQYVHQQLKEII